ncbi:hypothetical protein J6590_098697, partial [Homalodisca vitripennis]
MVQVKTSTFYSAVYISLVSPWMGRAVLLSLLRVRAIRQMETFIFKNRSNPPRRNQHPGEPPNMEQDVRLRERIRTRTF